MNLFLLTLCFATALPAAASPPSLFELSGSEVGLEKGVRPTAVVGAVQAYELIPDMSIFDRDTERLEISLPQAKSLIARRTHFSAEPGRLSWAGTLEGPAGGEDLVQGHVHFFGRGHRLSGIINVGAEQFQIVSDDLGHRLVRVELAHASCGLEPLSPSDVGGEQSASAVTPEHSAVAAPFHPAGIAPAADPRQEAPNAEKAMTYIDVLAVYPSAFSGSELSEMLAFVDDSVDLANDIFARSHVNVQYRLAAKHRLTGPDQPPATGVLDALEWLTPAQVGNQNVDLLGPQEVLDLRKNYAADMVALFVPMSWDADRACGIANLPLANGDVRPYIPGTPSRGDFGKRAFTVNRNGCGLNDYTFAHELGHNFGMRHNETESTGPVHLAPNGRGHSLSRAVWQDIAAGTLQTDVAGFFTVGYHFTPSVDGYVVGLGGLFNGPRTLKLWDFASGTELLDQIVIGDNSWTYEEILFPFELEAGKKYTVGFYTQGTGGAYFSNGPLFPRTSGPLTIHGTTHIAGEDRPTHTNTTVMYGVADVLFVPTADLASTVLGCARLPGGDIKDAVCHRIPYLSDPNRSVNTYSTGTPTRNNAALARSRAGAIAAYATNRPPDCQDDSLSTAVDTTLSVSLGDLLGNDSDPDGDFLRLESFDPQTAQGGTNSGGHSGGFNYTPLAGFVGTDSFSYTVADRPPGHPARQADSCTVSVEVTSPVGEVGQITDLNHVPKTVVLSRAYTNPVVIAQTLSQNGAETSVVRITQVQSDRFTLFVHEAPDRDGTHTVETVAYLVVEAGAWQLADGTRIQAGKVNTAATVGKLIANQWQSQSLSGFTSKPVVLSQVQTNNDPAWVKTRHGTSSASSFQVGLEEDESNTAPHGLETVGWFAIERTTGTWSGHPLLAGMTSNTVTSIWKTVSFGSSYAAPRLWAAMATYDGADGASLRYTNLGTTSVQVRVEEDTVRDPETDHTSEAVAYLVIGSSGQLSAAPR